jgi:hypothetical protein
VLPKSLVPIDTPYTGFYLMPAYYKKAFNWSIFWNFVLLPARRWPFGIFICLFLLHG